MEFVVQFREERGERTSTFTATIYSWILNSTRKLDTGFLELWTQGFWYKCLEFAAWISRHGERILLLLLSGCLSRLTFGLFVGRFCFVFNTMKDKYWLFEGQTIRVRPTEVAIQKKREGAMSEGQRSQRRNKSQSPFPMLNIPPHDPIEPRKIDKNRCHPSQRQAIEIRSNGLVEVAVYRKSEQTCSLQRRIEKLKEEEKNMKTRQRPDRHSRPKKWPREPKTKTPPSLGKSSMRVTKAQPSVEGHKEPNTNDLI